MSLNRRTKKIVFPRLQGRMILLMVLSAGAACAIHACVTAWSMARLAGAVSIGESQILRAIPSTLMLSSIVTLAFVVPIFLGLGIAATFRVFGPLYRFRTFIEDVAEGRRTEPCTLRRADELQDVCELLNRATEAAREASGNATQHEARTERAA